MRALHDVNVAVVIVNYRTPQLTIECLQSLVKEAGSFGQFQVCVVDGGSGDDSCEILSQAVSSPQFSGWVRFIDLPINGGFGWANNQAITALLCAPSPPDFVYLLNPDTVISEGAITALANVLLTDKGIAAVGSQLLSVDGSLAASAFRFPSPLGEFTRAARTGFVDRLLRIHLISHAPSEVGREVDWVTGASVMLRSSALREVGLFDDGFFLYHEEVELMWRLRSAGWSVWQEPLSQVTHIGGAATGVDRAGTGGAPIELPRRPPYWYESRRRYFARTSGFGGAWLAALSWIGGHLFWRLRKSVGFARTAPLLSHELRDYIVFGLPRRADTLPGNYMLDCSRPDVSKPAWMGQC